MAKVRNPEGFLQTLERLSLHIWRKEEGEVASRLVVEVLLEFKGVSLM